MAENLMGDLGKLGLGMMSDMDIYDTEESKDEKAQSAPAAEKVVQETDYLFDKSYKCPVCDNDFKVKAIKTGKAKLLGADNDLRPKYFGVDSLKYDSIVCSKCGYAALGRYFNYISGPQIKLIKEKITPFFKGVDTQCEVYSYDEAIVRHQLALANAVTKKGKVSERAYICLKLAWLFRGKAENEKDAQNVKELKAVEKQYIKKAYEGLGSAMYKEPYPIAGMDEWTCAYLVADLAVQCDDNTRAMKLLSDIIVSKAASSKLKDRARDLRKEIQGK